jgi:hypothetical protein
MSRPHREPKLHQFAAVYNRPTEGGFEAFYSLPLALWCGKLLEGKRITEGKRIAKVKLLKGKEWLKRG